MPTLLTETWNKQDESTLRNKEPGINQWLPLSFSMHYTLEAIIQRQEDFCQRAAGKVRKGRLRIHHNMSNKKWKGRRGKRMNQLRKEHFTYHRCRISSIKSHEHSQIKLLYQCLNLTPSKRATHWPPCVLGWFCHFCLRLWNFHLVRLHHQPHLSREIGEGSFR